MKFKKSQHLLLVVLLVVAIQNFDLIPLVMLILGQFLQCVNWHEMLENSKNLAYPILSLIKINCFGQNNINLKQQRLYYCEIYKLKLELKYFVKKFRVGFLSARPGPLQGMQQASGFLLKVFLRRNTPPYYCVMSCGNQPSLQRFSSTDSSHFPLFSTS